MADRPFACPFYEHDMVQDPKNLFRKPPKVFCREKKFLGIDGVKKHLSSYHEGIGGTHYCSSCNLLFANRASLVEHLRDDRNCCGPTCRVDYIYAYECSLLSRVVQGTQAQQWALIYSILFPGEPLPLMCSSLHVQPETADNGNNTARPGDNASNNARPGDSANNTALPGASPSVKPPEPKQARLPSLNELGLSSWIGSAGAPRTTSPTIPTIPGIDQLVSGSDSSPGFANPGFFNNPIPPAIEFAGVSGTAAMSGVGQQATAHAPAWTGERAMDGGPSGGGGPDAHMEDAHMEDAHIEWAPNPGQS